MDKYLLFHLTESGVSSAIINKIILSGVDLSKLEEMGYLSFADYTGVKKEDVYAKALELKKQKPAPYSIYTLTSQGISDKTCQALKNLGLTNLFMLRLYPNTLLKLKYNLTDSMIRKIHDALLNINEPMDKSSKEFKEYAEGLAKDKEYMTILKKKILACLSEDYIMEDELIIQLDECYQYGHMLNRAIDELIAVEYIENSLFGIKKLQANLSEFLFSMPSDRVSSMLKDYLNGVSLDRLSTDYSIAKEKIKPTLAKYDFPALAEDDYFDIYTTYYFTPQDFAKIFGVDLSVFRYLELKSKKPMGNRNVLEMLEDERVSQDVRVRVQNTLGKYAKLHGVSVLKTPEVILDIYARYDLKAPASEQELFEEFKSYWYNLFHESLELTQKAWDLMLEGSNALVYGKENYRYYNIAVISNEFYSSMNLKQYVDVELSTKIIFDANPMLMSSYDIRDEYELYHIMKKTLKKNNIEFSRRPMILFGSGNRNNQIKSILFEMSPITLSEFSKMYAKIFGVNEKAFTSYATKQFSPYYQDGVFTVNAPKLRDDILQMYKNLLTDDFYFISDIAELAAKEGIPFQEYYINKETLAILGFKDAGRCIYRNTYDSFYAYLEGYFKEELDLDSIDHKVTATVEFHKLLMDKISSYDYVEYETNKYISISKLTEQGITKELILDFVDTVKSSVYEDEIFTITSLKNKGFAHPILEKGMTDLFYASLFKPDKDVIYQKSFSSSDVLLKIRVQKERIGIAALIGQILEPKYYMYLLDIQKDLEIIYGIVRTEAQLKLYISSTEFYQNPDSGLYYLNYETYKRMK